MVAARGQMRLAAPSGTFPTVERLKQAVAPGALYSPGPHRVHVVVFPGLKVPAGHMMIWTGSTGERGGRGVVP